MHSSNLKMWCTGYYMYAENILKRSGRSAVDKLRRISSEIKRVYPGRNQVPIRANTPNARHLPPLRVVELCGCDECDED